MPDKFPDDFPTVQTLDDMLDQMADSSVPPSSVDLTCNEDGDLYLLGENDENGPEGYDDYVLPFDPGVIMEKHSQTIEANFGPVATTDDYRRGRRRMLAWQRKLHRWSRFKLVDSILWVTAVTAILFIIRTPVTTTGAIIALAMFPAQWVFIAVEDIHALDWVRNIMGVDSAYNGYQALSEFEQAATGNLSFTIYVSIIAAVWLVDIIVHNMVGPVHAFTINSQLKYSWLPNITLPVYLGGIMTVRALVNRIHDLIALSLYSNVNQNERHL